MSAIHDVRSPTMLSETNSMANVPVTETRHAAIPTSNVDNKANNATKANVL